MSKGSVHFLSKKFQRKKEDFICEHCSTKVVGDGYTNHCPECLWSKHVDINPGDRAAECKGLMEPVGLRLKKGEYVLVHRCTLCGYEKNNRRAFNDNSDLSLRLPVLV